jgi:hypothetical protein
MTVMVGNDERRERVADDDDSNKRVRVARVMVMAVRVLGDKEGQGNKEEDGVNDEGGVQQRGRWRRLQE